MRTLPRQHRGVAGSIAMLSRSLGTVTGATLLTLVFHAAEAFSNAGGPLPGDSFQQAFKATFWVAAAVSATAGLLVLLVSRPAAGNRRRSSVGAVSRDARLRRSSATRGGQSEPRLAPPCSEA